MNLILENNETTIELTAAFQLATGHRPDLQAIRRWYSKGTKGVRLEIVRIGLRVYTSVEAVKRFVAESSLPPKSTKRQREKAVDQFRKPRMSDETINGLRQHFPAFRGRA